MVVLESEWRFHRTGGVCITCSILAMLAILAVLIELSYRVGILV
jgi:hypothetical protein